MFNKVKDASITKDATQLREQFERLMFELGLLNKFNQTYGLYIQSKTNYGYYAKLYLRPGLSFTKLQDYTGIIQENLKCLWIMQTEQMREYADVQIVTVAMDPYREYKNPEIKPWEMYMGVDFCNKPIINNNNRYCMYLIGGATGSGKTCFILMLIMSWVLSCAVNEVEIYLCDIAKNEYNYLMYLKHVKCYINDTEQLYMAMKYLEHKIEKRKRVISKAREEGWATNIEEYNKASKNKLSYCYLIIDECSVLMPDKTDNKEETEQKQYSLDMLKRISKIGRSLGIFCINATQKTTRDEIPAIIKNMSAVRISFRANDRVSSEVIMGDHSAVGLSPRYAVYSTNGGERQDYLYSPYISTEMLNKFIRENEDKKHNKLDLEAELSAIEEAKSKPPKSVHSQKKKKEKDSPSKIYDDDFMQVSGGDYIDY